MRTFGGFGLLLLSLISFDLNAQKSLTLTPDRANVVASRLAGDWDSDVALTTRLTGRAPSSVTGADGRPQLKISFRSDSTVIRKIPQMMVDRMLEMQPPVPIYMSGMMTFSGKEHPFLLVSINGNMQVLFFQERGGDPMGDSESFIVQLGVANEPANDLLLVGGDFNNQPFSALKRIAPGTTGRGATPERN